MLVMFTGDVGTNEATVAPAWMDADDGWRALHQKLVDVSRKKRVLEAEETELLVEAEDSRLYRRLGHVSMHEYMEVHLGYTRHTANERLRTARELLELPRLREAYRTGGLSFTAVRELTRVATPATEEAFLAAAEGKTAGEVQQLVAGRGKGDTPATPPDPSLARRRVVLDLSAEEHAMWMRMRSLVADELAITSRMACSCGCSRAWWRPVRVMSRPTSRQPRRGPWRTGQRQGQSGRRSRGHSSNLRRASTQSSAPRARRCCTPCRPAVDA